MIYKYPKTLHLPWSPGTTSDDRLLKNTRHFEGKEVVVTEKLDGENTNMYRDFYHARSLQGVHHPSQAPCRQLWGSISYLIPDGWRICGENVYGQHSIKYDQLTSWFYVFSIWNSDNICLSFKETQNFCEDLNIPHAPVLYKGIWDESKIKKCFVGTSQFGEEQEGYVVRLSSSFKYDEFSNSMAKYVRKNHVQTNEFWKKNWVPNKKCYKN